MKLRKMSFVPAALTLLVVGLLVGCAIYGGASTRRASSVVQYLYPEKSNPVDQPTIPVLSLPMKVGIAFVPEEPTHTGGGTYMGGMWNVGEAAFSEKQKQSLMQAISTNFRQYPFVQSIEIIPSAYLTAKGSFTNLDQLHSMFGVDVITLLSYDQAQFTDEGFWSLTYWTVVGAYVVKGEKNDTKTMMDAAVYDIASRKLLFRAPGTSLVKKSATPVNLTEQLRRDSDLGFREAASNLVVNLQEQLEQFRERVKEQPTEYQVVHKPGYSAFSGFETLVLTVLGTSWLWLRRRRLS